MTKEEKIQILRETIDTKYDIVLALQKLQSTTGIEVGVRRGGNLKRMASSPFFTKGKFYGLDCWREVSDKPEFNDQGFPQQALDAQYAEVVKMFSSVPHVEIVRDFSVEGAERFKDDFFDFCYLDAAHDYDSVVDDLNAWWPKVKEGGVLSGHDYFPDTRIWRGKACGVYQAVNEFAEKHGTEVHHVTKTELEGGVNVACNSFFIVK